MVAPIQKGSPRAAFFYYFAQRKYETKITETGAIIIYSQPLRIVSGEVNGLQFLLPELQTRKNRLAHKENILREERLVSKSNKIQMPALPSRIFH